MTTRVQENQGLQQLSLKRPMLCALEKAMLCQLAFNKTDKVLDANVCSGRVAEYLLEHTECLVCGVSDRMEEVRQVRARLFGGDFAYAAIGDIPWPENTFDVVLLHPAEGGMEALQEQLRECRRVLKQGGRLILGLKCLPAVIRHIGSFLWESSEEGLPDAQAAQQAMESIGFEAVVSTQAGFSGHVLTGHLLHKDE